MNRGCFLSLDGIDGAGKTTQLELLVAWLRSLGHDVLTCRDPGSTAVGEQIRAILLSTDTVGLSRRAEMLLYMAARAQLVDELIRPALAAGRTVISDRYLLANLVYQGYAGGLDVEELREIGRVATGGLAPDLTLVLDLPEDLSAARIAQQRSTDRMEQQGDDFRRRLRAGFRAEADHDPARIAWIDAAESIDAVHAAIRAQVAKLLAQPPSRRAGATP
ncbi:MAG: dTMP kinase [Pirellulales bacterium]|nr:dTMP kinase [Pirellulales bacterium]